MSARVDVATYNANETAIFYAVKAMSMKIVSLLVEQAGCDLNACDGDGDTPLHLAFFIARRISEHTAIAEYLIEHGADVLAKNQQGTIAMECCAADQHDRIKRLFVDVQVAKMRQSSIADTHKFQVGSRVQVGQNVEPLHGFQGVSARDVMVVRKIDDNEVLTTFVDPMLMLRFLPSELQPVFDNSGVLLRVSSSAVGAPYHNLFDPDPDSFWQSDGERGQHWIALELPGSVELQALELQVHRGGYPRSSCMRCKMFAPKCPLPVQSQVTARPTIR